VWSSRPNYTFPSGAETTEVASIGLEHIVVPPCGGFHSPRSWDLWDRRSTIWDLRSASRDLSSPIIRNHFLSPSTDQKHIHLAALFPIPASQLSLCPFLVRQVGEMWCWENLFNGMHSNHAKGKMVKKKRKAQHKTWVDDVSPSAINRVSEAEVAREERAFCRHLL